VDHKGSKQGLPYLNFLVLSTFSILIRLDVKLDLISIVQDHLKIQFFFSLALKSQTHQISEETYVA